MIVPEYDPNLELQGMDLVDALPRIIGDPDYEIGRLLGYTTAISSVIRDTEASAALRTLLAPDSELRQRMIRRLISGPPLRLRSALPELSRISSDLADQVREELSAPDAQWAIANGAKDLQMNELIGLLRWAYRRVPELGERIEREVAPAHRERLAGELNANPALVTVAMREGEVAPLLHDVVRDAMTLEGNSWSTFVKKQPFGISLEKSYDLERNPENALSDPVSALRYIQGFHRSRRRRATAKSLTLTMRDIRNLQQVVDHAIGMPLGQLVNVLGGSARHLPEVHAALMLRLSRVDVLEHVIDFNLSLAPLSDFAALLSTIRVGDPRTHAHAVNLLSAPERASMIASRALTANPANWIGLLRTPGLARPVLGSVREVDWVEFWGSLPPEFPYWSRSIQQLLGGCGYPRLQRAPAEYILLGAEPSEWSNRSLSLRDLSNLLYGAGPLGGRMTLRFLDRIDYGTVIDVNYREVGIWRVVTFLDSIYREQEASILRAMITPTLTERLREESEDKWDSLNLAGRMGLIALLGAISLAGMNMPSRFRKVRKSDSDEMVDLWRHHRGSQPLVEAGLRRISLT